MELPIRTRRPFVSFRQDTGGIAAVEFAFILPVMLLIYLGTFDVAQEIMISHKAGVASETIGQIVAQQSTSSSMTSATISTILGASAATMAPFPPASLQTTVSAVDLNIRQDGTCCDAKVRWSYAQGGTLRPCGVLLTQVATNAHPSSTTIIQSIASPTTAVLSLGNPPTAVIVTDIVYTYASIAPSIDHILGGPIARTTYMFPRSTGQVTLATPVTPPNGQTGVVCS